MTWSEVANVRLQERQVVPTPIRATIRAAAVGAAASLIFGPLGIAAAAAAGGITGIGRLWERLSLQLHDGREVIIEVPKGSFLQVREWMQATSEIVEAHSRPNTAPEIAAEKQPNRLTSVLKLLPKITKN